MKSNKKLVLPKTGKKIAGVSIALANYFEIDVIVVRIVWALLILPGGLPGLLPYFIMWLMIPEEV